MKFDIMRMPAAAEKSSPIDVVVVVLPDSSIMSLASVLDPMRAANRVAGRPVFRWRLLSGDGQAVTLTCDIPISVDGRFSLPLAGDLLLVIGGFNLERHVGKRFLAALQECARHFDIVAGIESGCWLLGRSGLLNGRKATAHWEELEDFSQTFPALTVIGDRFVMDGKYWTSGGASPTFDMMLHLITERLGPALALDVASIFVYDQMHSPTDVQPFVSLGRIEARDPELAGAIRLMERTLERPMTVAALARRLAISQRKLELLFAKGLSISPGAYYLRLRLQVAHRLVRDSGIPMRDIALRCGFDSLSAFSRAYRREYGASPLKMRSANRAASAQTAGSSLAQT
ncbi:transcriptional regulator GlxA family with amidase domain [Sinorhizobium fredii]|jgi:transcriptional regulator GlxA family with amidase domain|uniref:HTH-type transcriptional regulator GlxA n=1 Tax=Sinorhizobium fredii (strain USDA 257) TaxID=1185652 RepID=I3X8J8_SINF2|nr:MULTISPECIES: GlxA family transcriptional regulator [Sinorhizobium]AFL52204.1 HTH-type transcriptional regulator GlxA [Sinorhizobium fredii USDA 257]PDT81791.1 GlxA family transcriptional regulator [Sinorhizobium sp. BJ1]